MNRRVLVTLVAILVGGAAWLIFPRPVTAHCDTLDGPVVQAVRSALEKQDLTPVLKWIKPQYEPAVRAQFEKVLATRKLSPEARDLADMYLFETVVRLHRAGEGAPYTGLQPAGTDPGAAVRAADAALEKGTPDELIKLVTDAVAAGLRERFAHAAETRAKAEHSVAEGRQYVAAYVDFVHYAERLHENARTSAHDHEDQPAAAGGAHDGEHPTAEHEHQH